MYLTSLQASVFKALAFVHHRHSLPVNRKLPRGETEEKGGHEFRGECIVWTKRTTPFGCFLPCRLWSWFIGLRSWLILI